MEKETRKRMRFRKLVLGTTILASLFILMAGLALAWYLRNDSISQTPNLVSAYADVAVSGPETGGPEYVAVVWSEDLTNHWGAVKLRWGPPGEPWSWPIATIEGGASEAREPAVAVYSDTAHVAYIKQSEGNWAIGYAKCPYGGSCQTSQVYASTTKLGSVDIALDGNTPCVVWAEVDTTSDRILFSTKNGSWSSEQVVASSGDNSSPSIACDNSGIVHIAWIKDDTDVRYTNSSPGNWNDKKQTIWYGGTRDPYNTSIAAYGGYVDVVFDYLDGTQYYVGERRRSPGESWCNNDLTDAYTSTGAGTEYIRYLRPAVAVYSGSTPPVPEVVWHAQVVDAHEVWYSEGTSFSGDCVVTWSTTPVTLAGGFSKYDCSAPSIAIGVTGTVSHTHVVFQHHNGGQTDELPWEIHYTSDLSGTLMQAEPAHNDVYLPIIMKNRQ